MVLNEKNIFIRYGQRSCRFPSRESNESQYVEWFDNDVTYHQTPGVSHSRELEMEMGVLDVPVEFLLNNFGVRRIEGMYRGMIQLNTEYV